MIITTEEEARSFCATRCDVSAMEKLERLASLLAAENEKQNLVAHATLATVWTRHIADSLQLLDHCPTKVSDWLDLGSGAGFPGITLAIARPESRFFLVESRKRRIEWLFEVCASLALENCSILGARLENVETFEVSAITARAFAPLGKLLSLSARFSTRSTVWLLPKGRSAVQELNEQPASIRNMFHVEQSATDSEAAILIGKGRPPGK